MQLEVGDLTVHNVITVNDTVTPIWNTMAVIPGHIKDEVVIIGNHRDGEFRFTLRLLLGLIIIN